MKKRIEKVLQRFFKRKIHVGLFLKNLVLDEGVGAVLEQIEQLVYVLATQFRCNLSLIRSCNRYVPSRIRALTNSKSTTGKSKSTQGVAQV